MSKSDTGFIYMIGSIFISCATGGITRPAFGCLAFGLLMVIAVIINFIDPNKMD